MLIDCLHHQYLSFFFFNDTATTEIYTLSLHDALPISFAPLESASATCRSTLARPCSSMSGPMTTPDSVPAPTLKPFTFSARDRKSTRLNSSHLVISYAVFCLKKKKHSSRSAVATHVMR